MTAIDIARPRSRRFWGDARFLIGVLLIALSIGGVWLVVASARQTTPVYAAAHTLLPGEAIAADDLRIVDVALGTVSAAYLSPAATAGEGWVATRTVAQGELLPADAVGAASEARTTSVVIRTAADVPAGITAGTTVEVWHAPPVDRESFDVPRILVADATVAAVTRDDAMIGGAQATLEVVIPRSEVAATLSALADGSVLSVVPVVGPAG
ncbi:SAF domain-containing protein [Microbacterium sp. P04]|uniref:SAF domain-containing protein n=1 Tax=Microbacterium sp. P04 TaxID=3366947 RepID=UPI003745D1CE